MRGSRWTLKSMSTPLSLLLAAALVGAAQSATAEIPIIRANTNAGVFFLELKPDDAPLSVKNFFAYLRDGSYGDSVIHRSEPASSYKVGAMASGIAGRRCFAHRNHRS